MNTRRQLSDEASAAFDRWIEDDSDQTFWQMSNEGAWVNSGSGGETNESGALSAGTATITQNYSTHTCLEAVYI